MELGRWVLHPQPVQNLSHANLEYCGQTNFTTPNPVVQYTVRWGNGAQNFRSVKRRFGCDQIFFWKELKVTGWRWEFKHTGVRPSSSPRSCGCTSNHVHTYMHENSLDPCVFFCPTQKFVFFLGTDSEVLWRAASESHLWRRFYADCRKHRSW